MWLLSNKRIENLFSHAPSSNDLEIGKALNLNKIKWKSKRDHEIWIWEFHGSIKQSNHIKNEFAYAACKASGDAAWFDNCNLAIKQKWKTD